MDPDALPDLHESLLPRRRFLALAGGMSLAPIALTGCQKQPNLAVEPENGKPVEGEPIVLRASRFTAAPDGRSKEIWGYVHRLPGPEIRVKEGRALLIKVVNDLPQPTSIHWHGMHQPGTWTMDGVDEVSHPPIPPGAAFTYEFSATPFGTHWYHSHVGVQYGNGLFGPLIVEEKTPIATYNRDEVLFMNDWFHQLGEQILAKLVDGKMEMKMPDKMEKIKLKDKPDVGDVPFQSGLINGRGRASGESQTPLTTLDVKKGDVVRFRLINGSSTYALRFQIDGHPLTVIASDGAPMAPVEVDNLILAAGERYDVIVKADADGIHWIRAATLDGNEIHAVLRYAGSKAAEPNEAPVRWGARMLAPEQMRSREPAQLAEKFREIPIRLGGTMMPYRWDIGGQFYPKADPFVIEKDEHIRIVFQNPTGMDHPFHLHGHYFHVLGKPGALNLKDPVQKDTINVPAKSDLVIQWQAKNPGRWFFHCHIEWHLATGMARVMEIKPY